MAESGDVELEKMTLVQLKGEAARRGLDQSGRKEDLIKRLQEVDSKTDVKEESKKEEQPSGDMPPKAKLAYDAANALRTVIINPFKFEVLSNRALLKWIDDSRTTTIKKTREGIIAAVLRFTTIDVGESACHDLKEKLKKFSVEVYHPQIHQRRRMGQEFNDDEFEELTRDQPDEPILPRWLVLENLPAEQNKEESLIELFPEAYSVYSCQCLEHGKGVAVLEFFSEEELEAFHKNSGKEMELDGAKVRLTKYNDRMAEWTKKKGKHDTEINLRRQKGTYTEEELAEREPLTDEERLELNKLLHELSDEQDVIQNKPDLFGQEKVLKYCDLGNDIRKKSRRLGFDTKRRIKEGKKEMPEPEEEMMNYTKVLVKGDENKSANLKEFERQLKWANYKVQKLNGFVNRIKGVKEDKTKAAKAAKQAQNTANNSGNFKGKGGQTNQRGRGGYMGFSGRGGYGGGGGGIGRGAGPMKRPGGSQGFYDYHDQPAMKRQQMSGHGDWRGGGDYMDDRSAELIHGLATAITNKMSMMTQMQGGGYSGGGMNQGYQGGRSMRDSMSRGRSFNQRY